MEAQEVFDIVKNHLLSQNKQSLLSYDQKVKITDGKPWITGNYAYRGIDNTKCAFGILIPDDVYCEEMEGRAAHYLIGTYSKLNHLHKVSTLCNQLQWIHDNRDPAIWEEKLRSLAKVFLLKYE